MTARLVLVAAAVLPAVVSGCDAAPTSGNRSWRSQPADPWGESVPASDWPVNHLELQHAQVPVHSGTTFDLFTTTCQLLGVKESGDPAKRKKAEEFTRQWFHERHGCISVLNARRPLMRDGVCTCWVTGAFGGYPYLNRDLVRAGLVEVDLSRDGDYTFEVEKKSDPDPLFHWQDELRKAREEFERGEAPAKK